MKTKLFLVFLLGFFALNQARATPVPLCFSLPGPSACPGQVFQVCVTVNNCIFYGLPDCETFTSTSSNPQTFCFTGADFDWSQTCYTASLTITFPCNGQSNTYSIAWNPGSTDVYGGFWQISFVSGWDPYIYINYSSGQLVFSQWAEDPNPSPF